MGATRVGRWRTVVLVLVHVLMAAHIIQWVVMGSTVSPVEPSESMMTLEHGIINAGAVLFALALVSTLIFGRFFCGWLCHVVALQDACAWLMNKMGIRPKPFRSRLLLWVPLALGFYMFIWPNFKRWVVFPAIEAAGGSIPAWLKPVPDIAVWRSEMIVDDFWATFPAWYIAVPFLLICGFATVYFLGAKGFCTYACPYGGLFAPAEKVAPVRIRVTDACSHCGHCTSVCTSNVRVSEEVRDFGMVVDPGCMKCMDCVAACPNDALYLGLGAPAIGKKTRDKESRKRHAEKAKRRYDLSWPEEIGAAGVFAACFFAFRGMFDQIPMLLAGGLAAIVTFLLITAWWTVVRPNTRLYGVMLRQKGRMRPAGALFLVVALGLAGLTAWGLQARYNRWRADIAYAGATIPAAFVVRPEFALSQETRAQAERALTWLTNADAFDRGGRGWTLNAEHRTRRAYYLALLGRPSEAADELDEVVEHGSPGEGLVSQLVRLRQAGGATDEEIGRVYERVLERHPELHGVRLELAMAAVRATGDADAGIPIIETENPEYADDVSYRFKEMAYWVQTGRADQVEARLPRVIELAEADTHNGAGWLADCAGVAQGLGNAALTMELMDKATARKEAHAGVWFAASEVAGTYGDGPTALERIEIGLTRPGGDTASSRFRAAGLLLRLGENERALTMYREAIETARSPFERAQIGGAIANAGIQIRDQSLRTLGLEAAESAAETSGEPLLFHDLAILLYRSDRVADAAAAMTRAAELAPGSAELAMRARDMWNFVPDADRASEWEAERERRSRATDAP